MKIREVESIVGEEDKSLEMMKDPDQRWCDFL